MTDNIWEEVAEWQQHDEDRNLEQARDMIHKAIQADPESGAYWDSMGWVEYKLGNFQEALQWLSKAAESEEGGNPVVRNHLGKVVYDARYENVRFGEMLAPLQGVASRR